MAPASPIKVLLVEDNPTDAFLLQEYLAGLPQFSFTHARRLQDALRILREDSIDIILSDLGLPDSAGLETFERLYSQSPDVPILVLTGLDDESLGLRAMQEGAQD